MQATDRGPELVQRSPVLATALNPLIGYDEAAKIAKEAGRTGKTIRELAREKGVDEKTLKKVLDPAQMVKPGLEGGAAGG
jgi:fumarate hydratase class II